MSTNHEGKRKRGWPGDTALGFLALALLWLFSIGAPTARSGLMRGQQTTRGSRWPLLTLGILELAIIGGSIAASILVSQTNTRAPLAAGAAATGMVFFVGVLLLGRGQEPFSIASMRHAIAAGFTTTFLFLLCINTFFGWGDENAKLDKVGQGFFDAYISFMKIIIPFYFATEGAIQGVTRYQQAKSQAQREAPDASDSTLVQ